MNRLCLEKSPYLLQHAANPVDWYPWGGEAFRKARAERKPLFLSIGYSTCHWCHVMAHESFEDERIAEVLNTQFVPVKVDREERPDVDRVYMTFVQATTGSGGWPMSVWLTPDLEPFYGGTYFPPVSRWGRPGFIDVLEEIARAWREDSDRVRGAASRMTAEIRRLAEQKRTTGPVDISTLERAVGEFEQAFDRQHGGFGGAPKFPRPSELLFLMREWARAGNVSARDMALNTLRAMARGGMHDQIGGGFHRYSVDARWHVPHFEKMLYDQAQLAIAYLEAFQITADKEFALVASRTLDYVARDLGRPDGGFYSAEDADSIPPGAAGTPDTHAAEGAFYVWTDEEFSQALGESAHVARLRFGVLQGGNAASDPHGELAGKNVLYVARSIAEVAQATNESPAAVERRLKEARARLLAVREARPRPALDDKLIAAWNGLMIGAFARASRVLRVSAETPRTEAGPHGDAPGAQAEPSHLLHAQRAAAFIQAHLWDAERGVLLRRYRDGQAAIEAYAEDFACLIFGLVELFQSDGDPRWLEWAIALQRVQDARFWDDAGGGWFSTAGGDASVLLRLKEDYDGAEPSTASVSLCNLVALSRLTGNAAWADRIDRAFSAFSSQLTRTPRALPMMLAALSAWLAPGQEVVIVGHCGAADTEALLAALASRYLPFAVTVPVDPATQAAVAPMLPFTETMTLREHRATAYVCRDFVCNQPTTNAVNMMEELRAPLA